LLQETLQLRETFQQENRPLQETQRTSMCFFSLYLGRLHVANLSKLILIIFQFKTFLRKPIHLGEKLYYDI
jgi:hypothetical protein